MMVAQTNRQTLLVQRPNKAPKPDDFELHDGIMPSPGEGQLLVRNSFLSLDPYMRGRMKRRAGALRTSIRLRRTTGRNYGGHHARMPVCGLVAGYNGADTGADHDRVPELVFTLITKRITMKGFMSGDHDNELDAFTAEMSGWIAAGRIKVREDITEGLERAPSAFIGMMEGANLGKTIIKL